MDERVYKSRKQEQKVAKEISGKTTPASGALWGAKADVRNSKFLVECKTTGQSSYKLSYTVWNKILSEALHDGLRIPVMCIDLNNGKKRLAVMCREDIPIQCRPVTERTIKSFKSVTISEPVTITYTDGKTRVPKSLSVIEWETFLNEVQAEYE